MHDAETHEHLDTPSAADTPIIALTETAIARLKEVMAKEGLGPDAGVRIAATTGGCSGMSYAMSFEHTARSDDRVLVQDGVKLLVDAASVPYLQGMTVDYLVGLHGSGFKFLNPRATRTCGCGTSFSA